ncbi:hypothetical protein LTR56_004320 [Elasticomyces elasticus]|nr:hypothetical protein LTR22_012048 [Elasticomyces elasticus]KAK3653908.1 hypothetical protein LTR56_004320 [Elasticomyces elasticus]KAK5748728.1 hypothetical protein LTS12_021239 [Elasticomyces elasticus]
MALSHSGFLGKRMSGKALEIGVCATASSGFFLLGYDQGVMSGTITEPIFLQTFPQMQQMNKQGAIQALVVVSQARTRTPRFIEAEEYWQAIYEIGCLFGALFIVGYGDKIGRRRSVLLGASIMLVGAAIQATSFGLAQLWVVHKHQDRNPLLIAVLGLLAALSPESAMA